MSGRKVPIQSLIDHIKTACDVDPWAKEMAEELLEKQKPVDIELEGGGSSWWYVCGECHATVDDGDRFCRHCGRPFRKKKSACDGCSYKGWEDCPLNYMSDRNFICPNGRLEMNDEEGKT